MYDYKYRSISGKEKIIVDETAKYFCYFLEDLKAVEKGISKGHNAFLILLNYIYIYIKCI